MAACPPQKLRYTHEAMVDILVAHPVISQNELATAFGYTPSWISTVLSSDAFKERLAARRDEVVNPVLLATVEERFEAVTKRSLEVLQEKLALPADMISDQLVLQAAALGARGMGKGGFGGGGAQVNVQVNVDANERLNRVAERISSLVRETREGAEDGIEEG
jgi:hypothetical protein